MVYCRYCGTQNSDGNLKCSNCGKPLPLMSNDPRPNIRSSSNNNQNMLDNNSRNNPNTGHSIKDKYLERNQNQPTRNNQNYQEKNYQNQPSHLNQQNYQNQHQYQQQYSLNQQQSQQQNSQNQQNHQYQQNYQNYSGHEKYQKNQEYSNNLHNNEFNQQYQQNHLNEHKEVSKTAIEWDVVIATALMVIILTAILQRIFPLFAIFISLLIGLAYILIATKSKSSLVKSIPLALLVILAISAYFSL